jgi:hypothetical protein
MSLRSPTSDGRDKREKEVRMQTYEYSAELSFPTRLSD